MNKVVHEIKVSVIVPTYNRAHLIANAVSSIIEQNRNDAEIIIVDDGSNDNTQSVISSLQEKYSNIFYYDNERSKGPSGARNTGIIKSSGAYISFLDSDDTWMNDHLKLGIEILDNNPEIDVLFGNYTIVDFCTGTHQYDFFDQKKILHTLKSLELLPNVRLLQDNLFEALVRENFFDFGSAIIRRPSAKEVLLDESIMFSEDRDFAIRLYKETNAAFAYREEPVFVKNRHESHLYNPKDSRNWQRVAEAHLYLFEKYLRIYDLSISEKRTLRRLLFKKLIVLSTSYGRNRKYKRALSYALRSCNYALCNSRKPRFSFGQV